MSICSNFLILHEYMNIRLKNTQNNQLVLTKSLVNYLSLIFTSLGEVPEQVEMKNSDFFFYFNEATVQILLNSYWKCKIFRLYLNGLSDFDVNLINSTKNYLNRTPKNHISFSFLETLFDLMLIYYYFNSKVSILFYCNEIEKSIFIEI